MLLKYLTINTLFVLGLATTGSDRHARDLDIETSHGRPSVIFVDRDNCRNDASRNNAEDVPNASDATYNTIVKTRNTQSDEKAHGKTPVTNSDNYRKWSNYDSKGVCENNSLAYDPFKDTCLSNSKWVDETASCACNKNGQTYDKDSGQCGCPDGQTLGGFYGKATVLKGTHKSKLVSVRRAYRPATMMGTLVVAPKRRNRQAMDPAATPKRQRTRQRSQPATVRRVEKNAI
ncbi:hypothetical protein QQZ08_001338 [Neonectria magnoliae]|uniref:WSC domain-containing protein n=1 Tax=Neonectria magnoliae TaxID=2732573 RepID=A0ABR1IGR4_9HYPO